VTAEVRIAAVVVADAHAQRGELFQQRRHRRPEVPAPVRVAHPDDAARSRDAPDLPQRPHRLAQVHHDHVGERRVEGAIREGQLVDAGDLEARVGHAALGRQGARPLHLRGLQVDADHLGGRHDLGHPERDGPGAAAHVQEPHAGAQVRQEEGPLSGRRPRGELRLADGVVPLV
jgi:hypothetical protein